MDAGFNVHISGRSIDKLQKKKEQLEARNKDAKVKMVPIDFSKPDSLAKLTQDDEVFKNLGILVNNVGYQFNKTIF